MLPESFLERMQEMLGEEYAQFLQSYDRDENHALRVNTLKSNGELLKQQLKIPLAPVAWNKDGFYYSKDDRPGRHPYHDAGVYYIQEASAMAPVVYLQPQPGERVLDLCAAPGGKSTQIGIAMRNRGLLVCNEIHPARARILSENIERMGICNAIVTNETPQHLEAAFSEYFDRILVDAPCSGEGMFRKNDEACSEWSLENVRLCAKRQDEILDCAANMLVQGGRLVYSTCTFAPLENEGTISRFLAKHPEFEIEPVEKYPGMAPGVAEWTEQPCAGLEGTIRLWPHKLSGEGHYVAVLRRRNLTDEPEGGKSGEDGRSDGNGRGARRAGHITVQKGLQEKECREYLEFQKEYLKEMPEGIFLRFGEQLYLAPEQTPVLDGIRVLRPGLHLGTVKKNRFEPSHALALTIDPANVRNVFSMSADSDEIVKYLQGQTIAAEGEKGWYLMAVDGYGIGWGKLSGTVMKNHYPKGLRRI